MVEVIKDIPWFRVEGHENARPGKIPSFSGELRIPIVHSRPLGAEIDEVMNSILAQRIEKLILLMKHYNLENTKNPWLLLSLRLGCAFVPGLRVVREAPRNRGRPEGSKKWTKEAQDELIAAVNTVRAKRKGRSIANSIQILQKCEPKRWESLNEARYYEALRDRTLRDEAARALTAPTCLAAPDVGKEVHEPVPKRRKLIAAKPR